MTGFHGARWLLLPLFAAALLACPSQRGEPREIPAPEPRAGHDSSPSDGATARPLSANRPPTELCVHQRTPELGAPAHRERGGRGGFVRLGECTRLAVVEQQDRWRRVVFTPPVKGRSEGWISERYVMSCGPCENDGVAGSTDRAEPWPPQPEGMCESHGATGQESLNVIAEPADRAEVRGGARGRPGTKIVVVSYNLWELYDGVGESEYLGGNKAHGGAPAEQVDSRLASFSRALRPHSPDILILQEVEGADLACRIASKVAPDSAWSCWSARARGGRGTPQ